ncbi:hypothetical protein IMSHALPRED_008082 [Imshaugia aleurites]|uniref:Uncharacterized protein n=1 Tax=Imshaugia aleurites TaxID=172621 RepID=A0A8H3FSM4_9LECA|nr:hypothetical protein IMSHALPRED_008082 [Imshaugia aleurites]
MASTQPTQLFPALRVTRADLSIKTADDEPWIRLESPEGDQKHNCFGVWFDDGITVRQENRKTGGTCSVKLTVESPPTIRQDQSSGRLIIEAKCLEIGEPQFDSKKTDNKVPGIEDAHTFALARLDKAPVLIKLGTLDNFKGNFSSDEFIQRINALTVDRDGCRRVSPGVVRQERGLQTLSLPPNPQKAPQKPSQEPTLSHAWPSPQGNRQEKREHEREMLLARLAELELETEEAIARNDAMLEERRKAALTAVNAEYDQIKQHESALLRRIDMPEKEKVQRGLDGLEPLDG